MKELLLKYGCNPNQQPARIYMEEGELPLEVLNGRPGYINFLDALNSWQLVQELSRATGLPAAASFKHVSPAGAALGLPLDPVLQRSFFVEDIPGLNESPLACAYARARGADRMSSFGDWIALSAPCDETTATIIKREVSDGIIAPGYTPAALEVLKSKRNGNYNIVAIDPSYQPAALERKQVFGITFEQGHNDCVIDRSLLTNIVTQNKDLPESAIQDLLLALITLKYTQSNSVCYAWGGQTIGVGAGQQSRISLHPVGRRQGGPMAAPPASPGPSTAFPAYPGTARPLQCDRRLPICAGRRCAGRRLLAAILYHAAGSALPRDPQGVPSWDPWSRPG